MKFTFRDRARQTSTTNGTGDMTLIAPEDGYAELSTTLNVDYYYCIRNMTDGVDEWEVGLGHVTSGAFVRSTIITGTNGNSAVSFTSGTKEIFMTVTAELLTKLTNKPQTGTATATTSDATPTDATATIWPDIPDTGGVAYSVFRYYVVAMQSFPSTNMKAWEGTLVYNGGVGSPGTDTNSSIHNPASKSWSIVASTTDGTDFAVECTGEAAIGISWYVNVSVESSAENGV